MKSHPTELALAFCYKHEELSPELFYYPGVVTMHAWARLAQSSGNEETLADILGHARAYLRGERPYKCNFPNYLIGGNAAAFLCWKGYLPEAEHAVRREADYIVSGMKKDADGFLILPNRLPLEVAWIDAAFAVVPFLTFAGLQFQETRYLDEATRQILDLAKVLRNQENGLLHQARGVQGPGSVTADHWSRGNGWAAYALTELAVHLPDNHPRKQEAHEAWVSHIEACAKFQDDYGMWHQEMTMPTSYPETSGSALLLYALGRALERGDVASSERQRFEKGLAGLLVYVSDSYDIFNTCMGCMSPGEGTILDYAARGPVVNDHHAFGPYALAFGQAATLGFATVKALQSAKEPQASQFAHARLQGAKETH